MLKFPVNVVCSASTIVPFATKLYTRSCLLMVTLLEQRPYFTRPMELMVFIFNNPCHKDNAPIKMKFMSAYQGQLYATDGTKQCIRKFTEKLE